MDLRNRLPRSRSLATLACWLAFALPAHSTEPAPAGRPAPQAAAAGDVLPFRASERTLANGLRVIVVPTGFPNLVSLQIPVQTGSRNEVEEGRSGFAHFFEHMMFRGTKAFPPDQYNAILTKAGARQNAYTTDDYTNYHTTFAREDLATMLRVEADRFRNLSYSEDAFRTESRAVLGEYNKNSANPAYKLHEVRRDAAFREHTYKHTTMGFLRDIERMPEQYEYSKTFFDRWYRPENTTIVIAGDVDARESFALVEKYWGGWKRGNARVSIPAEPAPQGPAFTHVPWPSATPPLVSVSFHGPAFSVRDPDFAAISTLLDIAFGPTSDIYRELVEQLQKVDEFAAHAGGHADPELITIEARVKDIADAVLVRDRILQAAARFRSETVGAKRLADAKSSERYGLLRRLDNTEAIASTLARYVRFERSFSTLNAYFRRVDSLTPADLLGAAQRWFTDAGMVVATLSHDPLPAGMAKVPALASFAPAAQAAGAAPGAAGAASPAPTLVQRTALPQITFKVLYPSGSANDPEGKEGLAALAAAMVAEAGSSRLRIDEIHQAFFPMAGSFTASVDKQMTVFTGSIHRDNWKAFLDIALPMLVSPGLREEDFRRLRDAARSALLVDLRQNNEEELAKERLQANVFAGTAFGHPVAGSARGLDAISLEDVRSFQAKAYARGAMRLAMAGDVTPAMVDELEHRLAALPDGPGLPAPRQIAGRRPTGLEVEIVKKETRATAISFGLPIAVTRSHPDFPALSIARAWLGEHRSSSSHLFQRIREVRGMNYGDYAYIEAFPRGMFQFFPDPNLARSAQLFEVWIRPVAPQNAHMALRIALFELGHLVEQGLTRDEFEATREYLMKNVFLATATQEQRLGYALDSQWYGIPEYTKYMRDALSKLTLDEVNRAIGRHLSAKDLSVVIVTRDAEALRDALLADGVSSIRYDGSKGADLLAEDQVVGAMHLALRPDAVKVTPVEEVFAR
jgi:zinc protease